MKRVLLFISVILIATVITETLIAQKKANEAPKTYSVTLTREQWKSVLIGLESIKNAVKTSSMTAAQSTFICDSIISLYQTEFDRQVSTQLAAEQKAKSEVKKDSTNKKK